MIYTITMNPSLDYTVFIDRLNIGEINRSVYEEISFGGKGINVSAVLMELGIDTKVFGFIAGFIGNEIERFLNKAGINNDFIRLSEGNSRINVKIAGNEQETALNAKGPCITENDLNELYIKIDNLHDNDILVLAGSLPKNLPSNIYERILDRIKDRKIKAVVDAEKEILLSTLKHKPFLIKPNHIELGDIFNKQIDNVNEIKHYAKELRKMGARNVIVSRGSNGAVLVTEKDEIYETRVEKVDAVNTVGAGDSMIAGFLTGYLNKGDYSFALALGTAAGTATALTKGIAKRDEIYHAFNKMVFYIVGDK